MDKRTPVRKLEEEDLMAPKITRDELQALLDRSAVVVVEALSEPRFDEGHIPGAVRVDYEQLEVQAPERLPDKDAAIVTYCANLACRNSEIAANMLLALGYTNVREYAEGKADWIEAGLPVEAGPRAAAM
jgi:rhodanese-related sulfurtransferase